MWFGGMEPEHAVSAACIVPSHRGWTAPIAISNNRCVHLAGDELSPDDPIATRGGAIFHTGAILDNRLDGESILGHPVPDTTGDNLPPGDTASTTNELPGLPRLAI